MSATPDQTRQDVRNGGGLFGPTPPEGMTDDSGGGPDCAHPARPASQVISEAADVREWYAILEALLFVSQDPLTVDRLAAALEGATKAEIQRALRGLQEDYEREGRGLQLVEVAGGFQLVTRAEHAAWVKRLEKVKAAPRLSRSALESLAIIAYKQPIVRAEVEQIRGVETSGVLRTLLERKLVRIVGRKDVPGRPIMYGTTKYFLQHFGLRDLSELPPLREFKELAEAEQASLPVGDDPLVVTRDEASAGPAQPEPRELEAGVGLGLRSGHDLQAALPSEPAKRA